MNIDRAIELLQKARQRYGGDRNMIITVELLDDLLRALDRMDRDVWREPRVRQVTPEAMAELERYDRCEIVLFSGGMALRLKWTNESRCWSAALTALKSRPTSGWFIDLSTIPEVTQ